MFLGFSLAHTIVHRETYLAFHPRSELTGAARQSHVFASFQFFFRVRRAARGERKTFHCWAAGR